VKTGPREGFRWTRESIIYAIDLWHRRNLRTPTVNEWVQAGEDHPCFVTVKRVFGSWNEAMRAGGFRPRPRGGYQRSG
jgi:Homing endonuclease associated repeat